MNQTIMETQTKITADLAPEILETLTRTTPPPTTPSPLSSPQLRWSRSWLRLETGNHPRLLDLERAAFEFCRSYSRNPRRGYRLLIHGPNGCGKTHTAKAVCRWAQAIRLKVPLDPVQNEDGDTLQLTTVKYLFWPRVVDAFKRGEWEAIEESASQSLLVLDDIGAEHDPSGIGREKLYYLLERRENRYTLLTTNVPEAEWEVKLEKRIASRFLRNCLTVSLEGVGDYCAQ